MTPFDPGDGLRVAIALRLAVFALTLWSVFGFAYSAPQQTRLIAFSTATTP